MRDRGGREALERQTEREGGLGGLPEATFVRSFRLLMAYSSSSLQMPSARPEGFTTLQKICCRIGSPVPFHFFWDKMTDLGCPTDLAEKSPNSSP